MTKDEKEFEKHAKGLYYNDNLTYHISYGDEMFECKHYGYSPYVDGATPMMYLYATPEKDAKEHPRFTLKSILNVDAKENPYKYHKRLQNELEHNEDYQKLTKHLRQIKNEKKDKSLEEFGRYKLECDGYERKVYIDLKDIATNALWQKVAFEPNTKSSNS